MFYDFYVRKTQTININEYNINCIIVGVVSAETCDATHDIRVAKLPIHNAV